MNLNIVEDEADKVGPKLLEVVHRHRLATTEYGGEQEGTVTHPVGFLCVYDSQLEFKGIVDVVPRHVVRVLEEVLRQFEGKNRAEHQ